MSFRSLRSHKELAAWTKSKHENILPILDASLSVVRRECNKLPAPLVVFPRMAFGDIRDYLAESNQVNFLSVVRMNAGLNREKFTPSRTVVW